jgi:hypothetical protein
MSSSGSDVSLGGRTLQQLRQMARSLRIAGYSSLNGSALKEAVRLMLGRDDVSTEQLAEADATAVPASSPQPVAMTVSHSPEPGSPSRVTFLPRDPQWAYVFWEISGEDRSRAAGAGAQQLCLRLADVTGLPLGAAHPHTLQEVVVEASGSEWFLPVPVCDRDYRVELGYRLPGGGWFPLAVSSVARIPADGPSSVVADLYVPFSLEGPLPDPVAEPVSGGVAHERHYQRAMGGPVLRRLGGSELIQDRDAAGDAAGRLSDSGAGVWASGRTESGSGVQRQRSFWLVADAELIVYGATDPSATLFIGDQQVPLEADGSFRVHVHFPDGEQHYPIRAVAADGEQERSIRLEFQRTTPAARVNTREAALVEWF